MDLLHLPNRLTNGLPVVRRRWPRHFYTLIGSWLAQLISPRSCVIVDGDASGLSLTRGASRR